MANAIYSFSMDLIRDKEYIMMLEQCPNKSSLVRHGLHQVYCMMAEREYRMKLEKLVKTYCEMAGAPPPSLPKIHSQCYFNNEIELPGNQRWGLNRIEELSEFLDHDSDE